MNLKLIAWRFVWKALAALFLFALSACGNAPAQANATKVQNTTIAIAQTDVALTQTAIPPTPTPTATFAIPTPSLFPTRPPFIPIMTPDTFQVAHWKEYQDALAKRFIFSDYVPFALCEWDILGSASQEVYVWAVCVAPAERSYAFAVIHLAVNGAVQIVEAPYKGDGWASDVQRMFPSDVQEKIASYDDNNYITLEMINHIEWRRTHPDEPPLIVLLAMPTVTPTP